VVKYWSSVFSSDDVQVSIALNVSVQVVNTLSGLSSSFEDVDEHFTYLHHYYLALNNLNKLTTALIGFAITLELYISFQCS